METGGGRDTLKQSFLYLFWGEHTPGQVCEDSFLVLKLLEQHILLFVHINDEKVFFCQTLLLKFISNI